ncbi:Cytochrome c family protein [Candidatus Hydrogenisulfobacillus filiaventi]|uniref:Cytochrome c family protein n=1 Tax=Candidatus Hydrogenisulfobacillus filiaventi TaxID=2707344 RepID=A0A6F8ZHN3_9FIRM|nr:c-type cytochrome [Bacillota bacterium]CAB1129296.1 Cytochrome c family protein [Candidatus Hydrogenisulfobacillus filiaventi]
MRRGSWRRRLWLAFGGLAVSLTGCGTRPAAVTRRPPPGNIAAGRALYERACSYCHGVDGQGGVRLDAPALWGPNSAIATMQRRDLADFIRMNMPLQAVHGIQPGSLSRTQADNLAAFLLHQNHRG